jgi:beta-lactamase class A
VNKFHRRDFVLSGLTLLATAAPGLAADDADHFFRDMERGLGGRVGLSVLDTGSGKTLSWRGNDRFAMCSSFKWLLAALILSRADQGKLNLAEPIPFTAAALLPHSPVTAAHLKEGAMSIEALCAAAVEESDNGATDLLLKRIGGPAQVTSYARSLGDRMTRLDRNEPRLNDNLPGDPRDTTTPNAMIKSMKTVWLGDVLQSTSREKLLGWLRKSQTGLNRLRAGLPPAWKEGDKTGTGDRGAAVDDAIIWPPGRSPILAAAYLSDSKKPVEVLEAAFAEIGRRIATTFT